MKKVFVLVLVIVIFTLGLSQSYKEAFEKSAQKIADQLSSNKNKIIGILPFESTDKEKSLLVADIYSHNLSARNFKIVDRKDLGKVIEEIRLSELGILEGKNADKLGNLIGADLLLTGSISLLEGYYYIVAKVIDVSSGTTIFSDMFVVQSQEFVSIKTLQQYLAERKYPETAAFRSALIPGWGQFYNDQPVKGALFLASGIGSLVTTVYFYSQYSYYDSIPAEGEQLEVLKQKAHENYQFFIWSGIATLTIWIVNILDAYLGAK